MKDVFRFAMTLSVVALVAAGSLAWVNRITRPKIQKQQANDLTNGLLVVLPGTENGIIDPVMDDDTIVYYRGFADKEKTNLKGYAFLVYALGYSSNIKTLVGTDTSGIIRKIHILSQKETPGLGTRCEEILNGETEPWWQVQFNDQPAVELALDMDGGEIQSITGATITSRAITDAIADSARSVFQRIESETPLLQEQ